MLNIKLPKDHYNKTTYPLLDDIADGGFIPLAYGVLINIPMTCIDTVAARYKCAGHAIHDFVAARTQNETLLSADYTEYLADGELAIPGAVTPYLEVGTYWLVIEADLLEFPISATDYILFTKWTKTGPEGSCYSIDGAGNWSEDATHFLHHLIFGRNALDREETRQTYVGENHLGSTFSQLALHDNQARTRIAQQFTVSTPFFLTRIVLDSMISGTCVGSISGNLIVKILSDTSPETQVGAQSKPYAFGTVTYYCPNIMWPLRSVDFSALYCDIEGATVTGTTAHRAVSGNVATIGTGAAHGLIVGSNVVISGMTDAIYNGTFVVTVVPDVLHFKYALTHGDEAETADTGGTWVGAIVIGADMVEDLIVNRLGKSSSILNAVALLDFKTNRRQEIAAYIDSDTTFGDIVGKLESSLLFKFVPLHDGTYAPSVYADSDPVGITPPHFFDEHFLSFSMRRDFSAVRSIVKAKYAETPDAQEFKVAEATSNVAKFVYGTEETLEVETYLTDGTDATTLAEDYLYMYETPPLEITFEVRGYGLDLLPGRNRVRITRTRATYAGGTLNGVLFRIVKITKKPGTASTEIVAVLDTQTYRP